MDNVRYGIIGLGNQGSTYIKYFFNEGKIKDCVITAVCDINPKRLDAAKEYIKDKDVKYFENYKDMLDSGLVDAVLVEVPHYLHPQMAIDCLERNINVLVEKPAGVYEKQVEEMNEASKKSGALFGMMFNQRTNPLYRKMRELVSNGAIGEFQRVTWIITDWYRPRAYYEAGGWRATWDGEGGGVLINQCPHQIDLLCWIIGEMPSSVNAFCKYGKWHDIEVEDDVTAYFEYKNGATGVFITTTGECPGSNRLEISGTKGKLLCENGKLKLYELEKDINEFSKENTAMFGKPGFTVTEIPLNEPSPEHVGILNNFKQAILGKEQLFVSGREGINGVRLMNAIEYSGWNGGEKEQIPVNLDKYLATLNEKRKLTKKKNVEDKVADTIGTY